MPEDQVVVVARRIVEAAGAAVPSAPAIPATTPAPAGTTAFLVAKLDSARWAQRVVLRYVTVATDYSTLAEMAAAIDALVLELEDNDIRPTLETLQRAACRSGRKLRDSFLIQANMARKSRDPNFNDLYLEQASERVLDNFTDFLTEFSRLAERSND